MSHQAVSRVLHSDKAISKSVPFSLKGLVLPISVVLGYSLHQLHAYLTHDTAEIDQSKQLSMAPNNKAAYLCAPCQPLEVRDAPYTEPDEHEIVIRNGAVAINPVNWIKQHSGDGFAPWMEYPFVIGSDVAGEVVQVGDKVSDFRVGDRVMGHGVGMSMKVNRSAEGAFQLYTILRTHMASRIPDTLSYESACVLPQGLSTAAQSMFSHKHMALPPPNTQRSQDSSLDSNKTSRTIVIWGGASSVGCNAIQLAAASGLRVITTASPRNHGLMKSLGAHDVFDYASETVIQDMTASINSSNNNLVGILAISNGSLTDCVDLMLSVIADAGDVQSSRRQHRKLICQFSSDLPKGGFKRGSTDWPTIDGVAMTSTERARTAGVEVSFVIASDIMHDAELSKAIYGRFIPDALAKGTFVPAPEPLVVGRGLQFVQEAMDLNRKGVSARKVVVSLDGGE